jgi:hypothetical protein
MELAGLEPATSWVRRSRIGPKSTICRDWRAISEVLAVPDYRGLQPITPN